MPSKKRNGERRSKKMAAAPATPKDDNQLAADLRRLKIEDDDVGATASDEAVIAASLGGSDPEVGTKQLTGGAPSEATCWICLGEGPDDDGQPLLRNCSCRGESGFGHLSCIVDFAKAKIRHIKSPSDMSKFNIAWQQCPNCMQRYRGELGLLLAAECIKFVENEGTCSDWRLLSAYNLNFIALSTLRSGEAEEAGKKCLSLAEMMKCKPDHSLSIETIVNIETCVFGMLGDLSLRSRTVEGDQKALQCFERAQSLLRGLPDSLLVDSHSLSFLADLEMKIGQLKTKPQENVTAYKKRNSDAVSKLRQAYEASVLEYGEDSFFAITQGEGLARCLKNANCGIASERMLRKILLLSRRVLGHEHPDTRRIEWSLSFAECRLVAVLHGSNAGEIFKAVRYESDGDQCVIQGPLKNPSEEFSTEHDAITVDSKHILPIASTPVICHGLTNATALNGKIGDVRNWSAESGRLVVHFDDDSIKPTAVVRSTRFTVDTKPEQSTRNIPQFDQPRRARSMVLGRGIF
ncbi:hypothetical protein ACHAXT_003614 [Thalassiosira profunda]